MRASAVKIVFATLLGFTSLLAAAELTQYEATCIELGFKKRSPAYGECVLELDRRGTAAKLDPVSQERIRQESSSRQDEIAEQQRGDGSVEHQTCSKFGFVVGTATYSDCRLKIDIAKRDQAQRQAAYDIEHQRYQNELQRYEAQVAELEEARERKKGDAMLRFGLALMGGTSPRASENLANAGRQSLGLPPIEPTRPRFQNFTITGPDRKMTNCNVFGNNVTCN